MKSKIKSIDVNKSNYPYVGRSKASGVIVLFTGYNTGVVLLDNGYAIGYQTDQWREETFERIDKITIEFES